MRITVKFFTTLREITGKKVAEIQLRDEITINELITLLAKEYGKDFREYIYNKNGKVTEFLSFLVNGTNVNKMKGLNTEI
jgi:MoaD family protein